MKTTKHLPLSKSSKHNLSAKVHQLSEEWELFKIQSKSNSEQRTEEVSSNLVKTLKKSLATPLTKENTPNLSHKILYRKSLTPLIKSKNSNFEVLISKCKLFQEGLYKTVNLNRLKRREGKENIP